MLSNLPNVIKYYSLNCEVIFILFLEYLRKHHEFASVDHIVKTSSAQLIEDALLCLFADAAVLKINAQQRRNPKDHL